MKITTAELSQAPQIGKAIIQSLDMSLYQLFVVIGDIEYAVVDSGRYMRSRSKRELQDWLQQLPVRKVVLRHSSSYDEMIGHPVNATGNLLEVPLGGAD